MKKYLLLILTLAFMALIYLFSAQTAESSGAESIFITEKILRLFADNPSQMLLDVSETVFRKLCHLTEYALLAVLWYCTLRSFGTKPNKLWISVCICILYAITDEIHQYFVPGRACRFYDIVIDSLGCALGYGICVFYNKRKKNITKS